MPFTKFTSHDIAVKSAVLDDNVFIHCMIGGEGPPLLLLHGYPQTHFMWHMIADDLASKFTVVAADLRGYGDSSKPRGSENHIEYSKKEMAADQVGLMQTIGFSEFFIVAHDRGARVAHRLAVDYPSTVKKMMLLDICPTLMMYETTDVKFAAGYWHWFFNIIPFPHPENIIMSNPQAYWDGLTSRATYSSVVHTPQAIDKYQSAFFNSETVHATCEDYRASASIDLDHDRADLINNHKISIPALRVLWGTKGMIAKYDDIVAEWRKVCHNDLVEVTGRSMECGHFIAEESSEELLQEIFEFLSVINDDGNDDRAGAIIS